MPCTTQVTARASPLNLNLNLRYLDKQLDVVEIESNSGIEGCKFYDSEIFRTPDFPWERLFLLPLLDFKSLERNRIKIYRSVSI